MVRYLFLAVWMSLLVSCQATIPPQNLFDVTRTTPTAPKFVGSQPLQTVTESSGSQLKITPSKKQTPTLVVLTDLPDSTSTPVVQSTIPGDENWSCPAFESFCIVNGHFLFRRPIGIAGRFTIDTSYRYGMTQTGKREPHHGVEFPNSQGTPVLAAQDGTVVFAGDDKKVSLAWVPAYYGNVVVIEHQLKGWPQKVFTLYAHLYTIEVKDGQRVVLGEQIGQVGATGTAIGSHLHFEVRLGQNNYLSNRNPELWLSTLDGMGAVAGRIENAKGEIASGMINVQRIENGVINLIPITSLETYVTRELQPVNGDDAWQENFSAGGLPAGVYRLTLHLEGRLYEQVIDIESGKLTFVRFKLK